MSEYRTTDLTDGKSNGKLLDNVILGSKSKVELLADAVKTYLPSSPYINLNPILNAPSSNTLIKHSFLTEVGVLKTLSQIPDEERLTPRYIKHFDHDQMLRIKMEPIKGSTYRDRAMEDLENGENVINTFASIPQAVATFHQQLNTYQKELCEEVAVFDDNGKPIHYLIRFRGFEEEKKRIWNYLRTIIYYCSPELEDLRNEVNSHLSRWSTPPPLESIENKITDYLESKNIDHEKITENFIRRDFELMYGTDSPAENLESLLVSGQVIVIHGDCGPQHIFESGRCVDFDECHLGSGETDLASALYNMYTFPDNPESELDLMALSFKYQETKLERKSSAEERISFLTRVTEARLVEILRIWAADCKSHPNSLRRLTKGHPNYHEIENDEDLRQNILDDLNGGLQHLINFYTEQEGWQKLFTSSQAHILYDQLSSIKRVFLKTGVFQGTDSNPKSQERLRKLLKESD